MAKPGDKRKSATGATYIWTGSTWVIEPKLKAAQIALAKKIKEENATGSWVQEWWNKAGPQSGSKRAADAERSWKSRSATSGTVSSAKAKGTKPPASSASGSPRTGWTGATGSEIARQSKPALLGAAYGKGDGKAKPPSSSKPTSTAGRKTSGASAKGGGRKPSVSQSRTMWVEKGAVVDGKTVKKGYLAQYGKPTKRVTANVRAVKGNAAGMKAGSVTRYKAGRKVKGK